MKQRYQKFVRSVYRYLRHPDKRKHPFMGWLSNRVLDRTLWSWQRRGVAEGVGWGLASAILPVPAQMLFSTIFCVWRRANIPIGALMCWLSPPGCFAVVIPSQWYVGQQTLDLFHIPVTPLSWEKVKVAFSQISEENFLETFKTAWLSIIEGLSVWHIILEFLIGMIVSCGLLGLSGYLLTQGIWQICRMLKKNIREDKPKNN